MAVSKHYFKRVAKIIYILFAVSSVCIAGIGVFLNYKLDNIIKDQLIETIASAGDGSYTLKIEAIETLPFQGGIAIKNIKLSQQSKSKYKTEVFFSSGSINFSNFKWWQYIRNKKITFDKIIISSPLLKLNDSGNNEQNNFKELPKLIGELGSSLEIKNININSGKVLFTDLKGEFKKGIEIVNIDLSKISSESMKNLNFLNCENITFHLKDYKDLSPNRKLEIKEIKGSLADSTLRVDNFSLHNNSNKSHIKNISVNGFDHKKLFFENAITANEVIVKSPEMTYHTVEKKNIRGSDNLNSILKDILPQTKINFLFIDKGEFLVKAGNIEHNIVHSGSDISIKFYKINVDSLSKNNNFFADASFNLKNYKLKSNDLNLSAKSLNGSYKNSSFYMNDLVYSYRNSSSSQDYIKLSLANMNAQGVDFFKLIKGNNTSIKNIILQKPNFSYTSNKGTSESFFKNNTPFKEIENVEIKNGQFEYTMIDDGNIVKQTAEHVYANTKEVLLNDDLLLNSIYKNINFTLDNYLITDSRINYRLSSDHIIASKIDSSASCKNVTITPYNYSLNSQKPGFRNTINEVKMHGLDVSGFMKKNNLIANKIDVTKAFLEINKKEEDIGISLMPQDLVKKFPGYLSVKKINISDSEIRYISSEPGFKNAGVLTFNKTYIKLSNLTNDKSINSSALIECESMLMGKGLLKMKIKIPLLSKNLDCDYKGSLKNISGKEFNTWMEFVGLRVKKGEIDDLSFDVRVSDGKANGKLKMLYHDLKLNQINEKTGKVKKLSSAFSNIFINKKK